MPGEKKCPASASKTRLLLTVIMVAVGAVGLYFLSLWASVAYLVWFFAFFFVVMPLTMCRNCYYRMNIDLEEWKKEYLSLHADCMKKWGITMFSIWVIPIVGIFIALYQKFSVIALVCLIIFVIMVVVHSMTLSRTICVHCDLLDVCPLKSREH